MGGVAAVIIRKEKQLVAHLREAGATSPERAKSLSSMQVDAESLGFRRLRTRAVVREASNGGWYLDEPSWAAVQGIRRRLVMVLVVLVLLGGVAMYFTASTAAK